MVDRSGAYLLADIIAKAHLQGAAVLITDANRSVLETLQNLKNADRVGAEHFVPTFVDAVSRIQIIDAENAKRQAD